MKFIFLQVMNQSLIEQLDDIRDSILARRKALQELGKEVGAEQVYTYSHGGVAYFGFNNTPDRKVWKKASSGYYPKANTKELEKIRALPVARDYIEVFDGYGNEGLIGECELGGKGWPMYSTQVAIKFETGFACLKVPYQGDTYDKEISDDYKIIKEWEYLKAMDDE